MAKFTTLLSIVAAFLLCAAAPADAARRAALVIGIDEYDEVPDLAKAVGDASAMAAKLRELGFAVTELENADRRTLNQAISTFAATLAEGDTAFVHFSGHGVEIDGDNYLLPADVPKPASGQKNFVKSEAIAMSSLIERIAEGGARTRVFVIDACRDNPFEQAGVRAVGNTRGLARVEAPAGTFIMYSAGYRQLALDRLGEDDSQPTSVYTRTLLKHLGAPGRAIDDVAQDVRAEVQKLAQSIGHQQRPAYYDELSARLVLVEAGDASGEAAAGAPPGAGDAAPAGTGPAPSGLTLFERAERVWDDVRETDSAAVLEAYISEFEGTVYAELARARLAETSDVRSPGAAAPEPDGEELAALPPADAEGGDEAGAGEGEGAVLPTLDLDAAGLAKAVQVELDRLGCDPGTPDGVWGRRSSQALERYGRHAGKELASSAPSAELLETLRGVGSRVCPLVCGPQFEVKGESCVKKTCPQGLRLTSGGACVAPPPAAAARPAPVPPRASQGTVTVPNGGAAAGAAPPVSDAYCNRQPCSSRCIDAGKSSPRCAMQMFR